MKLPKAPKGIPKKSIPRRSPLNPRPPQAPAPQAAPPPAKANPQPKPQIRRIAPVSIPRVPLYEESPAPPPPPPSKPSSDPTPEEWDAFRREERIRRWRQRALLVSGLAAFGIGVYSVQLWISLSRAPSSEDIPVDLIDRFDKEAEGYDEKVNTAERMLRVTSKRKAIMERAKGHVLEVAVGTGRNFQFYPTKKCDTITLLDYSGPMLNVAKRKWKDEQPEYFHRVFFKQQSALEPITPPYGAQDGYDTVIQTMGLCSTPEPVKLLRNLEQATKQDGQILLLEHGKSYYGWLNSLLDKTAPAHANEHGCWWNKDIGKIVEESGLDVVEIKRYNFGTTWWVELKPRKGVRELLIDSKQEIAPGRPREQQQQAEAPIWQRVWWGLWR